MKWEKQCHRYFRFFLGYLAFTGICSILTCCIQEYSAQIAAVWYLGTMVVWIVTAVVWISLLIKVFKL